MIKMVDLLVRKEGWSHDEFVEYWYKEHSPIAKELPGLRKYVTSVPRDPSRTEYDGVLELYFDDVDALKAAFDSEVGRRTQEDAAAFIDLDAGPTLIVDETTQFDATE